LGRYGTKYALGPAVFGGNELTSAAAALQQNSTQWVVNLTLNSAAAKTFGTLTTSQYNTYYPAAATNRDDAVLDSTAIVLDGNVRSAPGTQGTLTAGQFTISGPSPKASLRRPPKTSRHCWTAGNSPSAFTSSAPTRTSRLEGHEARSADKAGLKHESIGCSSSEGTSGQGFCRIAG
jgi:SecDF, P1 head subdomain